MSKSEDFQLYLRIIANSLCGLRMKASEQLALFPEFIYPPDELLLTYNDAFLLAKNLFHNSNLIPMEAFVLLVDLHQLVNWGFSRDELMTENAVIDSEFWREIRRKSKKLMFYFPTIEKFDENL